MTEISDSWQEKFHQFLKKRKVKITDTVDRCTSRLAGIDHLFSPQATRHSPIHSIATNIENAQAFLIAQHQRNNNIYAPDTICQYHRLPNIRSILKSGSLNDCLQTLYHYDLYDDSGDEDEIAELKRLESEEAEAYTLWEHHDPELLKDVKSHKLKLKPGSMHKVLTENIVNETSAFDFCSLVMSPPANKFNDSLKLEYVTSSRLYGIVESRFYKNNLSSVVTNILGEKMLVIGELSQLKFYLFKSLNQAPCKSPSFGIDIEPPFTTAEQLRGLTWELNPHTINFIKTIQDWHGGELLVVCGDDGQVLMWRSDDLFQYRTTSGYKTFDCSMVKPFFKLSVTASAWGVDLTSCKDSNDKIHDIAIISYNDRKIETFYYKNQAEGFVTICTDLLPHNIPEVSFLCYSETEGKHEAAVSLVSISNDILTYVFSWTMDDANDFPDVISIKMNIVLNFRLEYENWTTKPIEAKYFKKVNSLQELNGDFSVEQSVTEARVLRESHILDSKRPCYKLTSSLGIAANWQSFCPPVARLETLPQNEEEEVTIRKRDSQYNSIAQAYKKYRSSTSTPLERALALKFILVSSRQDIALHRADSLLCCARTSEVFAKVPNIPDEAYFCNRILISIIIPELSCLVAATQLGLITIMRLCQYRGIYSMRQEHIFPNFELYTSYERQARPLLGLAAKKMSILGGTSRYYLYLIYTHGVVLTYRLLDNWKTLENLSI